jgi:hypothetical protein
MISMRLPQCGQGWTWVSGAVLSSHGPSRGGRKIIVECEEKLVEFGIRQKCLVQGTPSFLGQGRDRDGQYRRQ